MLLFLGLRLAANQCGNRPGRAPDGGFRSRPPAHTPGQEESFAMGGLMAASCRPAAGRHRSRRRSAGLTVKRHRGNSRPGSQGWVRSSALG